MVYPNSCNTQLIVFFLNYFSGRFGNGMIAKYFMLGKSKYIYLMNFVIVAYLKGELPKKVKSFFFFMACNDQSLNRLPREDEMDIVLRYFNDVGIFEALFLFSIFKATK